MALQSPTIKRILIRESVIVASMKKKRLLSGERRQLMAKDIAVFEDTERLKSVLNKLSWKILQLLSKKEMYPMEVAKKLGVHEQKVYYHIRKLTKAGAVKVVREEERGRIAREIHDELGQTLTALKMDVHWLSHRCPKEEDSINKKLNAMSKVIDNTVRVVKRISSELRPILLDDFGLSAAIEWHAEEFTELTGIECHIVSDPEEIILNQAYSIAIFRIFQESLTNVARHADASKVNVSLKKNSSDFEMRIHDNGRGITDKDISDTRSFGLTGMRERAHYLKGKIDIYGSESRGTTVEISLPIEEQE